MYERGKLTPEKVAELSARAQPVCGVRLVAWADDDYLYQELWEIPLGGTHWRRASATRARRTGRVPISTLLVSGVLAATASRLDAMGWPGLTGAAPQETI